jgi:hypothetical protein
MKGQSIMDNPEKLATLDTLDIGRRKTKSQQKTKRCATLTPPKIGGKPPLQFQHKNELRFFFTSNYLLDS